MQHVHTLIRLLQIWQSGAAAFNFQQQRISSDGNRRTVGTRAVQLENINSTNDGGTLAYRPE